MRDHEFWSLPGDDLLGGPFDEKLDRNLRRKLLGSHICFGGGGKGGSSKAPEADPRIGEAALLQAQTGQDWLNFAREQFAIGNDRQSNIDALSEQVIRAQLDAQDRSNQWASEDRAIADHWNDQNRIRADWINTIAQEEGVQARISGQQYEDQFQAQARDLFERARLDQERYDQTFRPVEDRLVKDSMEWDSADRQAELAAQAKGDVYGNAQAQQAAQNRQLAAMGVDPRSGRYNATNRSTGLQTALAAAGAQNAARDTARQQAVQLRGGAAQLGQNVANRATQNRQLGTQATSAAHQSLLSGDQMSQNWMTLGMNARGIGNTSASIGGSNQGYSGLGLGLNAGTSAMNTQLGANNAWHGNNAIMGQGFSGAMQGYAGQAGTLSNLYGNQLSGWSAQNAASSANTAGLMGGIGSIAGMAMSYFSSEELKEDKRPVDGALDAIEKMPVEQWKYKDGIEDGGEHIGPYAEDFHQATGKGDGKSIPVQDAIGVTMKAVQELNHKVDKLAGKKHVMAGGIA